LYSLPMNTVLLIGVITPLVVWSSFWKIIGLWFSARKSEKIWFIVFIFINLVGILEIYYLYSRKCWPFKSAQ
jgi:hypothetical protein